jgi:UDP-N-acetylglucosamine/UDP-N-acetylgalactosamine 4-epimerase
MSPYAVTKQLNEKYASVYVLLHQMETIGLRYFNVFGPKQDPHGVYAAAIPRFLDAMLNGGKITVHGDGEQTRDFTYVKNAVRANILALSTSNSNSFGKVYNVACGEYFTLNSVISSIKDILVEQNRFNSKTIIEHGLDRMGDIKHSLADISETINDLGYDEVYQFNEGIKEYLSQKD